MPTWRYASARLAPYEMSASWGLESGELYIVGMAWRATKAPICSTREHWIAGDNQRTGRSLDECGKGGLDLAWRARVKNEKLLPRLACCRLHFLQLTRRIHIVRVYEHGDRGRIGDKLAHELKAFGHQRVCKEGNARCVTLRSSKVAHKARLDRIGAT